MDAEGRRTRREGDEERSSCDELHVILYTMLGAASLRTGIIDNIRSRRRRFHDSLFLRSRPSLPVRLVGVRVLEFFDEPSSDSVASS